MVGSKMNSGVGIGVYGPGYELFCGSFPSIF